MKENLSDEKTQRRSRYQRVSRFVNDFPWVNMGIGVFGGLCFFVGSVLFLFPALQTAAIWLFIAGSFGMLVGSTGEFMKAHMREKWRL